MNPSLELIQLVGAAVEGDITANEMERLKELLRESREARLFYLDHALLHSNLRWEHSGADVLDANTSIASSCARRPWFRSIAPAAVAAFFIAVLGIFFWSQKNSSETAGERTRDNTETAPRFHARLTALDGPMWDEMRSEPGGFSLGEWVPDGKLRLRSGRVTLTFDSGAMLCAEGPVDFDVEGPNRGFLHYGKVAVFAPPQASGFVLNTPACSIIDIGTRFGTIVGEDGSTEIHVIEGKVEVTNSTLGSTRRSHQLRSGQALSIARGDIDASVAPFKNGLFTDLLTGIERPTLLEPSGFVHWAFDEGSGRATKGRGSNGDQFVGVLEGGRNDAGRWVEGVHGTALALHGETDWLSTDYPGISGSAPRTVAMWVNIPPKAAGSEVPAILTWGGFYKPGGKWELVPNPYGQDGAVGALRLGCKKGFIVGTTDIQNGRWHHVAVVYSGGTDIVSHIKIYIDGKLDPLSGLLRGTVDTDTSSSDSSPLTIGRYIDPTQPISGHLRGVIDELYIFDGALTPQRISELAKPPERTSD